MKRAELSGDIERMQRELTDAISALEKLDATLLLFDPSYEIASIKPKAFRPPEDWSKRGEMTRLILGVLRKATEPLTSADIAAQLVVERAPDQGDVKLQRPMTSRQITELWVRDRGLNADETNPQARRRLHKGLCEPKLAWLSA